MIPSLSAPPATLPTLATLPNASDAVTVALPQHNGVIITLHGTFQNIIDVAMELRSVMKKRRGRPPGIANGSGKSKKK